jgi:hypothetical protein
LKSAALLLALAAELKHRSASTAMVSFIVAVCCDLQQRDDSRAAQVQVDDNCGMS